MSMNNALKLFWPSHCSSPQFHRRSGYIIGWLTKPATACVAAIIPDIEASDTNASFSSITRVLNGVWLSSYAIYSALFQSSVPLENTLNSLISTKYASYHLEYSVRSVPIYQLFLLVDLLPPCLQWVNTDSCMRRKNESYD